MNSLFKLASLLFILTTSIASYGQSATASASATLVEAMAMVKVTDLNFGTMTVPTGASTVVLSTSNTRTVASGDVTLLSNTPSSSVATFTVTGGGSMSYTITLPNSVTITETTGNTNTMTVSNFTSSSSNGSYTLDGTGTDLISVGATLSLGTDEIAGTYTGTFTVSVAYE